MYPLTHHPYIHSPTHPCTHSPTTPLSTHPPPLYPLTHHPCTHSPTTPISTHPPPLYPLTHHPYIHSPTHPCTHSPTTHTHTLHTYIRTYITYIHSYIYYITYIHTNIHIYTHTHIHTYTHTYIHTYTHTYIDVVIHTHYSNNMSYLTQHVTLFVLYDDTLTARGAPTDRPDSPPRAPTGSRPINLTWDILANSTTTESTNITSSDCTAQWHTTLTRSKSDSQPLVLNNADIAVDMNKCV